MTDPKPDRTEMWKAFKWTAILLAMLVVALGIFKAWQVATAPARVVGNAAGSVKSGASAVLNRLDVPINNQRRFDKAALTAFIVLNAIEKSPPIGVKGRGFRLVNLRGAQDRVCEFTYNFDAGEAPVFIAVDHDAYAAAKAVGSDADRRIRIVIVSTEETLGLNVEFNEKTSRWDLSWRSSSITKPHPDSWAESPVTEILKQVPKACN